MPYLHLDLPGTYPVAVKRELYHGDAAVAAQCRHR